MRIFPLLLFGFLVTAAAIYVSALSAGLPEIVAVHFNAAGGANGFMTRSDCRSFMLSLTVGAPLLVAVITALIPRLLPPSMINIPNRSYWLAPERARESIAFVSEQGIWFSSVLLIFLVGVDWMVAQANRTHPPDLAAGRFGWMLALFAAAIALWAVRLFRRFRLPR
jgi:uncharacterized membrane protein